MGRSDVKTMVVHFRHARFIRARGANVFNKTNNGNGEDLKSMGKFQKQGLRTAIISRSECNSPPPLSLYGQLN